MSGPYEFPPMDVATLGRLAKEIQASAAQIHGPKPGKAIEYALFTLLLVADQAGLGLAPTDYAQAMRAVLAEAERAIDGHFLPRHRERHARP